MRYRRKSLENDYSCSICYELLVRGNHVMLDELMARPIMKHVRHDH